MKKSSKTNSATIMSPAGDDIYQDATELPSPCTSDISTSVHVSIHITALSSGPFFSLLFFICSYSFMKMPYYFTLKCHLRVKIHNFFLTRFPRSDFMQNLLCKSREHVAKQPSRNDHSC